MTIVRIKARIRMNHTRKEPFYSGYMPVFDFFPDDPQNKIGGRITLLDGDKFYPGEEALVEIAFISREHFGNELFVGKKFTFGEGLPTAIGDGSVEEILED